MKIEFCPLCNFRFIRPTVVLNYRHPLEHWSDHWYHCPLCKLQFVRPHIQGRSCKNLMVVGRVTGEFLEISKMITDNIQVTFPHFGFKKLNILEG